MKKLAAIILSLMMGFPLSSFAAYRKMRVYSNRVPVLGATLNSSHPLSQGLKLQLLLNEGGGITLVDSTRSDNATLNVGNWASGIFGPAVLFGGGSSTYGRVPYKSFLDFSGGSAFTVSVWVYFNGSMPDSALISQFIPTYQGWMIWTGGSGSSSFHIYVNSGDRGSYSLSGIGWHHICLVYGGTGKVYSLYDNAVLKVTSGAYTTAPANTTNDIILGAYYLNGNDTGTAIGFDFNNKMEDMSIYRQALSISEIQQLAKLPFSMFAPQTQVFLDATGPIITSSPISQFFKSIFYKAVLR